MSMEEVSAEGHRSFGEIDEDSVLALPVVDLGLADDKVQALRNDVIGAFAKFSTPFGEKPMIYADWTASGRCLSSVENYMRDEVLPYYGNTHTTTSISGHQSTCFRHEARQIIAESVNAKITGKASQDLVLFCGNGTTAAVDKLVSCLGLQLPFALSDEDALKPVVFVSKMEHHSNVLPWRESAALVVEINYHPVTGVSVADLEAKLQLFAAHKVKIGSFSAASNVTGILTDVDTISILLHKHGALAFFDYATAAPYVKIDMNPVRADSNLAYKDAIFFSGHKFLGGPNCPGVLIVKKWLMPQASDIPSSSRGGGTVFYVTSEHHRYLSNREEREEGGSPQVLADIKMGLIFHVKRNFNASWIESKELEIEEYALQKLRGDARIAVLGKGDPSVEGGRHLPIFSFLIRCASRFLHFHFVSVLLNDLFGVQTRGGCMCAGPFAQLLLGITTEANQLFEAALLDKHEVLRPGFTRLSLPYWIGQEELDYILEAVLFVAEHGWKFLPLYRYNHRTGEWAHTTRLTKFPERKWLSNFSLLPKTASMNTDHCSMQESLKSDWANSSTFEVLRVTKESVHKELDNVEKSLKKKGGMLSKAADGDGGNLESLEHLRWFVLPKDIKAPNFDATTTATVFGPIQPNQGIQQQSQSTSASVELTAYAKVRDEKFKKWDGKQVALPRYITLFSDKSDEVSLLEILRNNLMNILQSQVATKEPTGSKVTAAKEKAAPSQAAASSSSKAEEYTAPECSTGSCFLPPRTAPVPGPDGKASSGPGNYFPADPSIKGKFADPPKKLMKLVGQAVKEWGMIQDGDRLLLGLSGGKDSLALLHVLKALQKRAPIKFEIACATVDPQTASFDPSALIPYVQSLGITYHYLSEPIVELAKSKMQGDSLCAFCSRFKRGLLYSCCRTYKYNKLVLAQHLDDLVESFFMSALHNGQIRTMKANYTIDAGDVHVIRPFIYVRETSTRDFSQAARFPIINENCPACFEEPKERDRIKKLLSQEEAMVPALFHNMKRALLPLLHDDTYEAMNKVVAAIEAAGNSKATIATRKREKDDNGKEATPADEATVSPQSKRAKTEEEFKIDAKTILEQTINSLKCEGDYCAPCFEIV